MPERALAQRLVGATQANGSLGMLAKRSPFAWVYIASVDVGGLVPNRFPGR